MEREKQGIANSDQQENVEVEEDETQAKESPPVNLHRSLRSRDSHGEGTTTSTKKNVSSTSSSKQQQQQSPRKGTNSSPKKRSCEQSPKKRSVESSAQEQAGPSFERFVMLYQSSITLKYLSLQCQVHVFLFLFLLYEPVSRLRLAFLMCRSLCGNYHLLVLMHNDTFYLPSLPYFNIIFSCNFNTEFL